jgi:prepilin-type N-terminal cleavage/methylation domain-containing protein
MLKNKKNKKSKKGFTLIELLIVVAIIAILAAIAIPQFAAYRIRGYNAAANSDLRNAKTAEEAMYADFQAYGSNVANSGTGSPVTNTMTLYTQDTTPIERQLTTGLSNNVLAAANGSENIQVPAIYSERWQNYTAFAKHTAGDRIFGADNAMSSLYWKLGSVSTGLAGTDLIASTTAYDLTGAGGFTSL